MASKNCAHSLHACQWERDILLGFVIFFALLNLFQLAYVNRAKLFRAARRAADNIPNDHTVDHERLYNPSD